MTLWDAGVGRRLFIAAVFMAVMLPLGDLCAQPFRPPPQGAAALGNRPDALPRFRLRIAWGGGAPRRWSGSIRIDQGTFSGLRLLGLDADAVGAIVGYQRSIRIVPRTVRTYDGVDVWVTARPDATITIELTPTDKPRETRRVTVQLSSLISQSRNEPLDDQKNRLQIRRAPGDALRIKTPRDHLVFRPGETFKLRVHPYRLGLPPGTTLRSVIRLTEGRTRNELDKREELLRVDENGDVSPLKALELQVPKLEGVYDIIVSIYRKRITDLVRTSKPTHERKLQFVVLSAQMPVADAGEWREILSIDHRDPAWWKRLVKLPQWNWFSGFDDGPIDNGKVERKEKMDRPHILLKQGGWQAFPLAIDQVGRPHVLEIEYPNNEPQTLGISILEPDSSGQVVPLGLDSGVTLAEEVRHRQPAIHKHRLVFWPSSKTPLVLFTNRGKGRPAMIGRVRVLAGPKHLRDNPLPRDSEATREFLAYYDKPLFPENFGASDAFDPVVRSSFQDWRTFFEGGNRLIEYLRNVGYSGAVISVASDGSTIYPSKLLTPTPHYDKGVFFSTGQDLHQKDVLEMLFRMFDRAGLTLVPAIEFSSPLEELEQLLRQPGQNAAGLELINYRGRRWLSENRPRKGLAPYYNPLNEKVQQAMTNVVGELSRRYGHHASFGGISLQTGPHTYAQMPGLDWGYDKATIAEYEKVHGKMKVKSVGEAVKRLRTDQRRKWDDWRGKQLEKMFLAMQKELPDEDGRRNLYLATANTMTQRLVEDILRPQTVDTAKEDRLRLQAAIDVPRLRDQPNVIVSRPQRIAPLVELHQQAANLQLRAASSVDETFRRSAGNSYLYYHEPQQLTVPSFDQRSPFGPRKTQTWLSSTFCQDGALHRRRFIEALARLDAERIVDGGWMVPMGQEDSIRDLVWTYRQLPAVPFQTEKSRNGKTTQPVVVRSLRKNGRTYLYLLNDSPWPVRARMAMSVPATCRIVPISRRKLRPLQRNNVSANWTVELQPYDLVAAVMTSSQTQLTDIAVEFDPAITAGLQRDLFAFRNQIFSLRRRKEQPLNVARNSSFEQGVPGQPPIGWSHGRVAPNSVRVDNKHAYHGDNSLNLKSSAPRQIVWVRGSTFDPPDTGRLAISFWIRGSDPKGLPPLRVAVDGVHAGKNYYRWQYARRQAKASKPADQWSRYLFLVKRLPAKELKNLRIGFDLMDKGEVWIDGVEVFDLWFDDALEAQLLQRFALQMRHPDRIADAHRFLYSYWPRFVRGYLNGLPERMARRAANPAGAQRQPGEPEPQAARPSMFDRFKIRWPKFF